MTKMIEIGDVAGLLNMSKPPFHGSSMWEAIDMGVREAADLFAADDMKGYRANRDILDEVLGNWGMAVTWTDHLL